MLCLPCAGESRIQQNVFPAAFFHLGRHGCELYNGVNTRADGGSLAGDRQAIIDVPNAVRQLRGSTGEKFLRPVTNLLGLLEV